MNDISELDYSHLSDADRAVLMNELVKLRDRRNGLDSESVLRGKLKEVTEDRDRLRAENAALRRRVRDAG